MNSRMSQLDGLRGVAILLVFFYHAFYRWSDRIEFINEGFYDFFSIGYLGVNLFFMISGYVIFLTLDNSKSALSFMLKRWLRLFPCMLICSIIIFASGIFFWERPSGIPMFSDLIPGFSFIAPELINFVTGYELKSLEGSFWSLYVEFTFYVICAGVYFLLGRRFVLPIIFTIAVTSFFILVLFKIAGVNSKLFYVFNALGFKHYCWFFIGCIFYIKSERLLESSEKVMLCICLIISLLFSKGDYYSLLGIISIILLFASVFKFPFLIECLSSRLLVFLGFISYPLYLLHEGLLVSIILKVERLLVIPAFFMFLLPILILVLFSVIAYPIAKFIEPSIKKLLLNLIKKATALNKVPKIRFRF